MPQQISSATSAGKTPRRPLVWRAVEADEDQASGDTESHSSGYSGKTNEFLPGYVETRLAVEKMIKEYDQRTFSINQLDLNDTWPVRSRSCYLPIRILFKHKEGNKAIRVDTEPLRLEAPLKEGVTDSLGNKVELLAIPQEKHSLQCTFWVGKMEGALIYDTESDDIFIRNIGKHVLSAVPMSRMGAGSVSVMPMELGVLPATLWEFSSGEDKVEVELLPRQYLLRVEQSTTAIAGSKRPLSSEEDVMQQKKARGIDETFLLNSATTPLLEPRPVDLGQPRPAVVRKEWEDATAALQLEPFQRLCIVDRRTGETEYSFTRLSKWERRTRSSELFRAILRKHATQKGEVVVVKVIKDDPVADDDDTRYSTVADKWVEEYRLLSRLKHPHIAGLVSFDARIWSLYIEHRDGQDLASPKWCFSEADERPHFFKGTVNDACHILADMASALAYMGRQGRQGGIMHGNINPGNIIYRRHNAKVSRFSPVTQHGATLIDFSEAVEGTSYLRYGSEPWYSAPKIRHKNLYGRERDIYALGVVMLYLIGRIGLPERTETEPSTWNARVEELRKSLQPRDGCTGMEAELVAIVRAMLLRENRLTAEQLEVATRKWASKTIM